MRSRFAWFVGGLGFAAAVGRFLRRSSAPPATLPPAARSVPPPAPARVPEPVAEPEHDPRAEELRRRLEESRALVDEREEFESGETTIDRVEAAQAAEASDPDDRRRDVHDRGQAAIDRMRRDR